MQESSKVITLEQILNKLELMDQKLNLLQEQMENVKLRQTSMEKSVAKLDEISENQKKSFANDNVLGGRLNKIISTLSPDVAKPEEVLSSEPKKDEGAKSTSYVNYKSAKK